MKKNLPVCYITNEDDLDTIIQKSLKTLQKQGLKTGEIEYYKEQASLLAGRCVHAGTLSHAMMIIRYYVVLRYK